MFPFTWRSESDEPAPARISEVDDRLRADEALKRVRRGEYLLYTGDFQNAKQLLSALGRRLPKIKPSGEEAGEAFRAERRQRLIEHQSLSRLLVALDADFKLPLPRAPDVREACRGVWGPPAPDAPRTIVPLKQLIGMMGAAEWRRKGLEVPGLEGRLHPHYGVYLPTRVDYVDLLLTVTREFKGKTVFDIGTGTGILSFLLLQRGAKSAVATDVDPRAIACASENAKLLGLSDRFEVQQTDLFPAGRADLIISNPPWIPEPPKNRVDRAVFDPDSAFLTGFLNGLTAHLNPGGFGLLILSDLAVLLGLREPDFLDRALDAAGLTVKWKRSTRARHDKAKDRTDRLHEARTREVTSLYALEPRSD